MNIDYISIGARIKYLRTQKGLSQEELAEFADVSPVYISNIERGEKSASLKTVIAVANALNISTDSILMDNLSHPDDSQEDALFDILCDCSKEEHDIIIETAKDLKSILRHYTITK
jgi:transcriptional regulator with XRE-family HTH domain